jgi:agmatinase
MDVLNPAYCAGLGTPEPFGLTDRDIREVLHTAAPYTIGFDVVEIAPEYDNSLSAILATKLMREFIFAHYASKRSK